MGPRLFSRGKIKTSSHPPNIEHVLQWGHDFSAVERAMPAHYERSRMWKLQWGHDFSAVERI